MKKFLLAAAAATAVMASAAAAHATTIFTPINLIGGSSIFGAVTNQAGSFVHSFSFSTVGPKNASSSVVTVSLAGLRDVDFSSIDLDGMGFTLTNPDPVESWGLTSAVISAGLHTITLHGSVAPGSEGSFASYSGTLNIASVPEPATWALMIGGFGAAGAMLRRRRALAFA